MACDRIVRRIFQYQMLVFSSYGMWSYGLSFISVSVDFITFCVCVLGGGGFAKVVWEKHVG